MKKADLEYIKKLLERIKPQDEHVAKAIAFVERDLSIYNSKRGQIKDMYSDPYSGY